MRTLRIIEHISLDGVIQHSADEGDFPYSDWTAPYRTPAGRDAMLAAYGGSFDLLLGRRTYDIWSGFGERRRVVRLRMASMRQQNSSLRTVRKVLNGARSKALDRTSSRAFAASRRRTARTLSSRVAPRSHRRCSNRGLRMKSCWPSIRSCWARGSASLRREPRRAHSSLSARKHFRPASSSLLTRSPGL